MNSMSLSDLYDPIEDVTSVSFSILGWTADYSNGLSQLIDEPLAMLIIAHLKRNDEAYAIIANLNRN